MSKGIDECRARGCGGWLRGVGSEVSDGETATCGACHREHTFHVFYDGATPHVTVARKPRPTTGKIRGRGGKGGWVSR